MGTSFRSQYKPGASKQVHLFFAGLLWTVVGITLFVRGWHYVWPDYYLFALCGIVLGWGKSHFVLDKTAKKSILRIKQFSDKTCLGAVYSRGSWGLVFLMMGLGILLRMSPISKEYLGIFCCTVGSALILSSRHGWSAWWHGLRSSNQNS